MNANDLPGNEDHHHHNGNGNGNGNGKIFTLKPTTHPDTLAILDARDAALKEPRWKLKPGAKAFFVAILDHALNPEFFDKKGVVTLSDQFLAKFFSVTKRTIYDWKTAVERADYFWTSKKWRSNMWPMTTYHVAALHPKPTTRRTDDGGSYGGGKLRPAPFKGVGGRQKDQLRLALPGTRKRTPETPKTPPPVGSELTAGDTENADLQGISAESRNLLPLSAENNCGSEPQIIAAESRNKLRLRAENNCGSEPQNFAAESRSNFRPTAEANCPLLETQTGGGVGEAKEIRGGGEGKPTTTPREDDFSRKYPAPEWEPLDAGMFQSKRDKFCEAGIALATEQREKIANDPLSRHPGDPKYHAAALAVRKAYRERIDTLKKFWAGQKVNT